MATFNMNDYWENQGQIPTLADVEDGLEAGPGVGLTISDITQDDMGTGASVVTIDDNAPTPATNGAVWVDTSTLAGAPELRPRIYNNASSEWLGFNIYYSDQQPSTSTTGWIWYDMYAKVHRVYRAAAYDPNGVAGWHPISAAYQLWKNKSGGILLPGRVVTQYIAGATDRGFKTSTAVKDCSVVGVTLATISNDGYGLIATVAGGATVPIYCNVTDGNIALGDGICQSSVAGEGRTVGTMPVNVINAASTRQSGTPLGCFAVALEAVTTATVTKCRLLGKVGDGATYRKASTTIAAFANGLANANWDGGWDAVDMASYPPGAGGNDFIADAKHKPIAAAILCVDAAMDSDNAGTVTLTLDLNLGPDGATALQNVHMDAENNNSANSGMMASNVVVPTSLAADHTAMGNVFYWSGTKSTSAGNAAVKAANFKAVGYIY